MADGINYRDSRPPFRVADDAGITAATTMKALWAPAVSNSPTLLPANYFTVGKILKLTANIKHTAVANTNNITWGFGLGTADAAACHVTTVASAALSSTTTFDYVMQGWATCRSTGTAGTMSLFGFLNPPVGLVASTVATGLSFPSAGVTVVSTLDTTAATTIWFEFQRATTAGDTILATNIILEALN